MNGSEYSNREIDAMMKSVHEKLDQILTQTTKTNGRVNTLETEVSSLGNWKSFTRGALSILSLLMVPILIFMLQHYLTTK